MNDEKGNLKNEAVKEAVKEENLKSEIAKMESEFFDRSHQICDGLAVYLEEIERGMVAKVKEWLSLCVRDSKLSVVAGRVHLTDAEKKMFFKEVQAYCECIESQEELQNLKDWKENLQRMLSSKKVTRMEAVHVHLFHGVELLYAKEVAMAEAFFVEVHQKMYESVLALLGNAKKNDGDTQVEALLQTPWAADEKNFYDRLEMQKKALIADIEKAVVRSCAVGSDATESIELFLGGLQKSLKTVKNRMPALFLTEKSYFFNLGICKAMMACCVEAYRIVSVAESGKSKICMEMHDTVVVTDEFGVGATAPPFHVRCRSVIVPVTE